MRDCRDMAIGLFGGSFNPAHAGHLHVASTSLKALGLDQVWWMASPQNPLKPKQPTYESRVKTIETLGIPPNMVISHMEIDFGTQYTVDMLRRAQQRWPGARFVFLMGADNFLQLPRWKDWRTILSLVPVAVISRPGGGNAAIRARLGQAARLYADYRIPEERSHTLAMRDAPAWCYLTTPLNSLSSSAIRAARSKA